MRSYGFAVRNASSGLSSSSIAERLGSVGLRSYGFAVRNASSGLSSSGIAERLGSVGLRSYGFAVRNASSGLSSSSIAERLGSVALRGCNQRVLGVGVVSRLAKCHLRDHRSQCEGGNGRDIAEFFHVCS